MAVYTDLTDEDLATLLAAYDLGEPLALKGIAEGVENSNFYLETRAGRFILTLFERRVREADLPFFLGLTEHAAARGAPAPPPVRRRDGGLISQTRGKPAAIVTFLEGVSPRRPTAAQVRALGASLGRLHCALADFALTRENGLSVGAWGALVRPRLALADALRPGLARSIAADLAEVEAAWPAQGALPAGAIHADLFPDNTLFLGERVGGLIDFYFACTDHLAYDLAVCLNAWCFEPDGDYNITKGRALLAAYAAERPLSAAEGEALPLLCRGAAIRFFATRLADWADTPTGALVKRKDPLEYADKLEFHRRARGAAAYGWA